MAEEEEQSSVKDVYKAVTSALRDKGFLDQIEGETRKEVLQVLKEGSTEEAGEEGTKPSEPPQANFIINELIREYLEWNGLTETSQVLTLESGQPKTPVARADLEKTLKLQTGPNARQIPLLYSIVSSLKNN